MYYNFFFFNDTATTEIYTLSLHDALPISEAAARRDAAARGDGVRDLHVRLDGRAGDVALHADDEAHFDFPREGAHRELAHEARARDRHVHLDRPAAGELEIEGGVELLVHGRGHGEAQVREIDVGAHVDAARERELGVDHFGRDVGAPRHHAAGRA